MAPVVQMGGRASASGRPVLCVTMLHGAGTNISTSEEVAIKLESVKSKHPQLLYE